MPTPTKGPRLGGSSSHQKLMLANLATSLFTHGRITTTEVKARRVRPLAEKLITKAKRGDLHNRRQIMRVIRDKNVVHKLIAEIGPSFADRAGGYIRITQVLPRQGDNAPMAVIELVSDKTVTAEAEAARKTKFATSAKKKPATADTKTVEAEPTEETAVTEAEAVEESTSVEQPVAAEEAEAPAPKAKKTAAKTKKVAAEDQD